MNFSKPTHPLNLENSRFFLIEGLILTKDVNKKKKYSSLPVIFNMLQ